MKVIKCFVIVLALVLLGEAADLNRHWPANVALKIKVERILKNVPKEEKQEFLRYHLQKGHELQKVQESETYPQFHHKISEDDSVLLYNYYSANKVVDDEEVKKVATSVICWEGQCIDFSDPGVHPY